MTRLTKEGLAILASELRLQLSYIRESGNRYRNIDLADQLVARLIKEYPLEAHMKKMKPRKLYEIPTKCHKCHLKINNIDEGFKTELGIWYHKDCYGRNRG